jgi:thiol-disulfide isomerase/thioredoxin
MRFRTASVLFDVVISIAALLLPAALPGQEKPGAGATSKDAPKGPEKGAEKAAAPGAGPESSASHQQSEALFAAAQALFRKGESAIEGKPPGADPALDLRLAAKAFEDILRDFPREEKAAQSAYNLGTSYLLLDEPQKALAAYQKVFDEYPQFKERALTLYRMGVCLAAMDEPLKARLNFAKIVQQFRDRTAEVKKAQKAIQELEIVGRPAPALKTTTWLQGMATEGLKTFQGEVLVLYFFATWCPNCQKEVPHLRSLISKLSPRGAIFLGVANPEDPESREAVDPYLKRNQIEYVDVALDPKEASWIPFRVFGFPAALVIDRKGIVRWRGHPAFLPASLVEKLLHEK